MLDNQYLVRTGAMLNMPMRAIQRHNDVWGNEFGEFNARRFLKPATAVRKESRKLGGFMSFGISPVICPGRHMASVEVLAIAAMFVLRFEITPYTGTWTEPKANLSVATATISPPTGEFPVKMAVRDEYKGLEWEFGPLRGDNRFNLIIS
jgi:cytochrome P450